VGTIGAGTKSGVAEAEAGVKKSTRSLAKKRHEGYRDHAQDEDDKGHWLPPLSEVVTDVHLCPIPVELPGE
jgi:hypothetical protein